MARRNGTDAALVMVADVLLLGGWGTIAHLPLPALTLSLPFMA